MENVLIKEKGFLNIFKISLLLKGITAVLETAGGILVWFTSKVMLVTSFLNIFQNVLSDDPKDYISIFIVSSAEKLAVGSQYFFGSYLFLHGIVKLFLVICLYKKKVWAYPTSIIIFTVLIFYEIYTLYLNHSLWTLSFILLDILVVLLTGHEYGVLKKRIKKSKHEQTL